MHDVSHEHAVHNVQAPNHGLKKRALKKAATRAIFFC
jgi:hypothetical protein